jgi:hypothetical protein
MEKRKKGEGRPPKIIKQEKNIGFFVTNVQYFIIQHKAEQAGVNISDYMRQMAINGQVKTRWTEEERFLFKKMVAMSNDINQLARNAQKEGAVNTMLYFNQYRDRIDEVLKHFGHDQ